MTTVKDLLHKNIIEEIKKGDKWQYLEKHGNAGGLKIYSPMFQSDIFQLSWVVFEYSHCIDITEDLKNMHHIEDISRKLEAKIVKTIFSIDWETLQVLVKLIKSVSKEEV